uniref:Xaa-Pro dipeptidyl-peptidase C-terminal domain-containing protein n=1 Tax=Chromera velia CCMP2878 TaxID=1169474 RepID=A0A0G4I945_9ALVE|eukprot:Cvel_12154.t1-p1 / transcript=Cvel_12154.t1 / gene=Cvel_12154 / organism=Chromera_velia_CCMP2878 / gene_product=Putative serine esterase Mb1866c, putative / transcript_product=Putative serine esterase Mb1866c, putative / location=Cvel_scaffold783:62974-66261(-) / protein_length=943 / sequence_SO=supercontig / SO=protein_coding / is_pseudo=false
MTVLPFVLPLVVLGALGVGFLWRSITNCSIDWFKSRVSVVAAGDGSGDGDGEMLHPASERNEVSDSAFPSSRPPAPFPCTRIHIELPMEDGEILGGNVLLPEGASRESPVPVILEYLPYRKDDSYYAWDFQKGSFFARRGFAFASVDVRGTGSSGGRLVSREYSERELRDGETVIGLLSEMPWCSGSVGMMGISWGGFNSLMLAARAPPALKAVVSLAATEDMFYKDVHFMYGIPHFDEYILSMDAENALPRTPDYNLDSAWLADRFEQRPWTAVYLSESGDSKFWREHSPMHHYSEVSVPLLMVTGLYDLYKDFALKVYEGVSLRREKKEKERGRGKSPMMKVIVGPYDHAFPDDSVYGPNFNARAEMARWFHAHLTNNQTMIAQIEKEPDVSLFVRGAPSTSSPSPPPPLPTEDLKRRTAQTTDLQQSEEQTVKPSFSFSSSASYLIEGRWIWLDWPSTASAESLRLTPTSQGGLLLGSETRKADRRDEGWEKKKGDGEGEVNRLRKQKHRPDSDSSLSFWESDIIPLDKQLGEAVLNVSAWHSLAFKATAGVEMGVQLGDVTPTSDMAPFDDACLTYDSEPLTSDIAIAGFGSASLRVRASAPLAHWFVRIGSVSPDGFVSFVVGGMVNGGFREGRESPAYLEPGRWYDVTVPLEMTSWAFPKGHRVRVSVGNSLFRMVWPSPFSPMTTDLAVDPQNTFVSLTKLNAEDLSRLPVPPSTELPVDYKLDSPPDAFPYADRNVSSHIRRCALPQGSSSSLQNPQAVDVMWHQHYCNNARGWAVCAVVNQKFSADDLSSATAGWSGRATYLYVRDVDEAAVADCDESCKGTQKSLRTRLETAKSVFEDDQLPLHQSADGQTGEGVETVQVQRRRTEAAGVGGEKWVPDLDLSKPSRHWFELSVWMNVTSNHTHFHIDGQRTMVVKGAKIAEKGFHEDIKRRFQ